MEQLKIQQAGNSVIFSVKVVPRSSKTSIAGILGGMLKVKLAAAPEKGKANKAVAELLAKKLGLKKSQIELVAGETSHQKRFLVRGINTRELAERITIACGGG